MNCQWIGSDPQKMRRTALIKALCVYFGRHVHSNERQRRRGESIMKWVFCKCDRSLFFIWFAVFSLIEPIFWVITLTKNQSVFWGTKYSYPTSFANEISEISESICESMQLQLVTDTDRHYSTSLRAFSICSLLSVRSSRCRRIKDEILCLKRTYFQSEHVVMTTTATTLASLSLLRTKMEYKLLNVL